MVFFLPLNNSCPFSCSYCIISNDNKTIANFGDMWFDYNDYIGSFIRQFDNSILTFHGGEPADENNIQYVNYYFKNTANIQFEFFSNVGNIDLYLKFKHKIKKIYASFHREFKNENYIENIKKLRDAGIDVVVREILLPNLFKDQELFRKKVERLGFKHEYTKLIGKEINYTDEQKTLFVFDEIYEQSGVNINCSCRKSKSFIIDFNGDIKKCFKIDSKIGTIFDTNKSDLESNTSHICFIPTTFISNGVVKTKRKLTFKSGV